MSVPERLSVDGEETRGRKESDKSNASENVSCGERGAFLTGAYFVGISRSFWLIIYMI